MKKSYKCSKCGKIITVIKPSSEQYVPECSCNIGTPMVETEVSKREPGWECS